MPFLYEREMSQSEKEERRDEILAYGNHKSANEHEGEVLRLLQKDVAAGFALPIPRDKIGDVPGVLVQPAGMVHQWTPNADGTRKLKMRLTHDATFTVNNSKDSVNDRIDLDSYTEMIYGWCLSRVLHFVAALRWRHPGVRIFIAKFDFSDAYRRVHYSGEAALEQVIAVGDLAYIMLRMSFGGSANPPVWCGFSEMVTDLANEIVLSPEWDPKSLHSPQRPKRLAPILNGKGDKVGAGEKVGGRHTC